MQISEVRIKLMNDPHERLLAFCSITFDVSFVIRDLKIIQGAKGAFVAMPSRKLMDRCPKCHTKNHLRASFCNQCGVRLDENRADKDDAGRARLYADIAHPINSDCRELIQEEVLKAYEEERVSAQQDGYVCRYDDFGEEDYARLGPYEEDYDDTPQVQTARSESASIRKNGQVFRIDAAEEKSEAQRPHHSAADQPAADKVTSNKNEAGPQGDSFGSGIV
ncbi:SpoVG family protein [Gimesia panareensis]|uniref:Septation protein SpoVG n=1 Tax=Gimesia panareensis TaxID=2527978 RepID=A0A518ABJ8_9PLAN|nr:SpoVG family protein [Gimesia panareensis]QDU52096.1 Putative septation protein SpoVG [Gimesia panareensis]QDV20055.1 Putative septation protein SpoVG [Gimesia panareensis]